MITAWLIASLAVVNPAGTPAQDTVRTPPLELVEVLESTLRTHPAVSGARARLSAASASAGEARAAWLPRLSVSAQAVRHQEPMVVAPLHGFDIRTPPQFDETLYQAHASAEYTLFDGGARVARVGASRALEASAESGLASARDAVLVDATTAYLSALTARDVLRAHGERVRALEEELSRARLLFEEGTTPRLAVLRTEAALSRARAERETADEALRLVHRRLARVSGLDEARVLGATLVDVRPDPEALPGREALVARALSTNPGLARASSRVEAASRRLSVARSAFLPRVALSGRYSAFGAGSVDFTGEWQAGVRLSYPLFTGGARRAVVGRAKAEAEAARSERRLAERRVTDAVDAALLAHRSARARVAALEAAVAQSEEVARIEALALEAGAGVQTDYLRAEAELLEVRSALAEARHAAVEARVRLAQATGALTPEWLAQMTEGAEQ